MDNKLREIVAAKLGALMMGNAELSAVNLGLRKQITEHQEHVRMLQSELKRWQDDARKAAETLPTEPSTANEAAPEPNGELH